MSMKRPTKRDADTESLEQAVAAPSTVCERDASQESSPERSLGSITPPSGEVGEETGSPSTQNTKVQKYRRGSTKLA